MLSAVNVAQFKNFSELINLRISQNFVQGDFYINNIQITKVKHIQNSRLYNHKLNCALNLYKSIQLYKSGQ